MLLSPTESAVTLAIFGLLMIVLVWLRRADDDTSEQFLVANRKVSLFSGAFSIAVSWIWAPAVFICSMQAYQKGLPGIFWFTFPNILCFFVFAPLAIRFRKLMPNGYTLPEFIFRRYQGDKKTHIAFLVIFLGYQLGAIIINSLAGGTLLHVIGGIDLHIAIVAMTAVTLTYSMMSGLKASIFTDVIQMAMILVIGFVLVPWCVDVAGGVDAISGGKGGKTGEYSNIFDSSVAYSMGIPLSFGLIAGPIGDQMFFQRVLAVQSQSVVKTFVLGGLLFGTVPIILSLLGFIAANPEVSKDLVVEDEQVVGAEVLGYLLPKGCLIAFCVMAIAGLASTLDSSFCAVSSLGSMDIYVRYIQEDATSEQILKSARITMVLMAILGTGIALFNPKLFWIFQIYNTMASAAMFPTILSLSWGRLTSNGAFWAVLLAFSIGTPLSIYANINEEEDLIVISAVVSVGIGLVVCLLFGLANTTALVTNPKIFDFASLEVEENKKSDGEEEQASA